MLSTSPSFQLLSPHSVPGHHLLLVHLCVSRTYYAVGAQYWLNSLVFIRALSTERAETGSPYTLWIWAIKKHKKRFIFLQSPPFSQVLTTLCCSALTFLLQSPTTTTDAGWWLHCFCLSPTGGVWSQLFYILQLWSSQQQELTSTHRVAVIAIGLVQGHAPG